MDKQFEKQQMVRDRATYHYLDSLDNGDIDGIIESLQQAVYDASLDQMLIDAHQAYFREELGEEQIAALAEVETQKMVALEPATLNSRGLGPRQKARTRHVSRWIQALAAVLILSVLIGSLVTMLALHKQGQQGSQHTPTPSSTCQPYSFQQFTTQNTVATTASLSSLVSVAAISANDAWAVGYTSSAPGEQSVSHSALIEHWDGKSWRIVPSQASGIGNDWLYEVKAVSANDVWAVGYSRNPSDGLLSASNRVLIEHWDGQTWQITGAKNGPTGNGLLNALTVVAPNDIWAAGLFYGAEDGPHPLLEHWDGANWQTVSLQGKDAPVSGMLNGMIATSAHDVWVVGAGRYTGETQSRGLVLHWNGSQWQPEPVSQSIASLNSISAISPQNIWATGADRNGRVLIEHWDGRQWNNVALPASFAGVQTGLDISAVSANDVWAVGSMRGGDNFKHMLLLHWDGESWQQIVTPTLLLPYGLPNSVASGIAVYGGRQVWIVGSASDTRVGYNSALILGQSACS